MFVTLSLHPVRILHGNQKTAKKKAGTPMAYTLPDLPYEYSALEPTIDSQTMELHHQKHHGTYVTKLNAALEGKDDLLSMPITDLLRNLDMVPAAQQLAVRNNGGGHANHTLFWTVMSPSGGGEPTGELAQAIEKSFSDFASFQNEFTEAALNRFGSGWAWLVLGKQKKLLVTSTPNQDSPVMEGLTPILGLDVWEHAYYLKYQNRRPEYIENWWKVVDWEEVARRYQQAL
jgi:Fe-Mn family superoxide dismutase